MFCMIFPFLTLICGFWPRTEAYPPNGPIWCIKVQHSSLLASIPWCLLFPSCPRTRPKTPVLLHFYVSYPVTFFHLFLDLFQSTRYHRHNYYSSTNKTRRKTPWKIGLNSCIEHCIGIAVSRFDSDVVSNVYLHSEFFDNMSSVDNRDFIATCLDTFKDSFGWRYG